MLKNKLLLLSFLDMDDEEDGDWDDVLVVVAVSGSRLNSSWILFSLHLWITCWE